MVSLDILRAKYGWVREAHCIGADTSLFFPSEMPSGSPLALDYCRRCPVRSECLEAAMAEEEHTIRGYREGIRGGMLPDQRERLAKARRQSDKRRNMFEFQESGREFRPVEADLLQQLGL